MSSANCIFCKIINRTHEADILFEDDELIIFKDIKPAAKHHVLIVPKVHVKDPRSLTLDNKEMVEKLIAAGKKHYEELGLNLEDTISGFHWPPFNSIQHLHLHFINPASEMGFIARCIFKPNTYWFVTPDYILKRLSSGSDSHL